MIIDPEEVLAEQIQEIEKQIDDLDNEIDSMTRRAVTLLLIGIAYDQKAEDNMLRQASENARTDRIHLESKINHISAEKVRLSTALSALKHLHNQIHTSGGMGQRLEEYINRLNKNRIDLPPHRPVSTDPEGSPL